MTKTRTPEQKAAAVKRHREQMAAAPPGYAVVRLPIGTERRIDNAVSGSIHEGALFLYANPVGKGVDRVVGIFPASNWSLVQFFSYGDEKSKVVLFATPSKQQFTPVIYEEIAETLIQRGSAAGAAIAFAEAYTLTFNLPQPEFGRLSHALTGLFNEVIRESRK